MAQARTNPWVVLVVLTLGFFMILLDTTIVNVAIPAMSSSQNDGLNTTLDQILWVLNAYILVYAVLLITAGRLGDLYGQRNLFALGLFIFTLASALCGVSQNAAELIAARILQGVGGALLKPPPPCSCCSSCGSTSRPSPSSRCRSSPTATSRWPTGSRRRSASGCSASSCRSRSTSSRCAGSPPSMPGSRWRRCRSRRRSSLHSPAAWRTASAASTSS